MTALAARVAAAPISWGICEVPGWGHQLEPGIVLNQMSELGLTATELGPPGFLPDNEDETVAQLSAYGLRAVAEFVPVLLHEDLHSTMRTVHRALDRLVMTQSDVLVIAASLESSGYEQNSELSDVQWDCLFTNVARIERAAEEAGIGVAVHPHVGTAILSPAQVRRLLDGCGLSLCLDTGHYAIGGGDAVQLVRQYADRIAHVHLKDVRLDKVRQVQSGATSYQDAVGEGLFAPLGQGEANIGAVVAELEQRGYAGWYVLEQDVVLAGHPRETGVDPMIDVSTSLSYLMSLGLPSM